MKQDDYKLYNKTILKMKNLATVKLYLVVKSISNAMTLWKSRLRNSSVWHQVKKYA